MTEAVDTKNSLIDRVQQVIEEDKVQLPPLPEVAIRLQNMLAKDDADAGKVTELLRNEPALTVALLRFANSAAFGGLRQISDLRQAIARLGLKRVAGLVTAMQIKEQFTTQNAEKAEYLQRLWDHSVCTAILARQLARRLDADVEEAFLAGLLHDCGRLLILRATDYLDAQDSSMSVTMPVIDDMAMAIHASLGAKTLASWNLPVELCTVAERHEEDPEHGDSLMLTIIQAAISLTRKLGMHPNPDESLNPLEEPAVERLGMEDVELATMMVDAEDEFDEVRRLFNG